jgi:RHS repeat-associated protein
LISGWSSANTGTYSWGENYSIDAWGNLQISPMGTKAHGGTFQLSGSAQNRPTGMAYDAAGNLMSYVSSTYTYDQENRLSSTAGMSYTYDGNGERVLKSNTNTGAAVKRYWSMGGNTLAEGDGSGTLTAEYVYFGSKRVARIDLPANTVHYYLSDHLASTSIVASGAGAIEEESDYYPFGTEVVVSGSGVNELKFTGKRRDTESQLDYYGARYYGNVLGRFTSADPITVVKSRMQDPQQFNLYAYVRNNPLRFTDSTGMKIDESELSDKDKKKFQHIRDIANQTGKDGKLLHPVLHDVIAKMDADSRTFVVENSKLDNGTGGQFTITDFTADGKDFTKATVQIDFKQINGLSGPFASDLVPGFNKYQGLFGVKDENGLRLAETFGHEGGGHGIFAIDNPAQSSGDSKSGE